MAHACGSSKSEVFGRDLGLRSWHSFINFFEENNSSKATDGNCGSISQEAWMQPWLLALLSLLDTSKSWGIGVDLELMVLLDACQEISLAAAVVEL